MRRRDATGSTRRDDALPSTRIPMRLSPANPALRIATLLATLASATTQAFAGAPLYRLEMLDVPDATGITATDINSAGQVVGYYFDADFYRQAVLWDGAGTARTLAVPPGEIDADARAINDTGQIVGNATDFAFGVAALLWDATTPSVFETITSVQGEAATANDINSAGVVVGGIGGWQTGAPSRAFVWTRDGGIVDHGVPDEGVANQQARWNAVNDAGMVVGHWNVSISTVHATVGDAATPAVLTFGGESDVLPTIVTAVNNDGVAVGLGLAQDDAVLVPVVFHGDGSYAEIPGAVLDQDNGAATAINDAGVIVGTAGIGSAVGAVPGLRAWVHLDGVTHDLFQSVDSTGPFESFATAAAINADGVIVGSGRLADGTFASFRLTPTAGDVIFGSGFELPD
jgi:uncharacterized membrane protein